MYVHDLAVSNNLLR